MCALYIVTHLATVPDRVYRLARNWPHLDTPVAPGWASPAAAAPRACCATYCCPYRDFAVAVAATVPQELWSVHCSIDLFPV